MTGVGDDAVWKNGMGMFTAITENSKNTEIIFFQMSISEIDHGSAVIGMNVSVSGGTTDGTGLPL